MKIYYNKETKIFAGAVNISSEYKDKEEIDFIEILEEYWLNFLNDNQGKIIKVVNGELKGFEEKKIPNLKILKENYLKKIKSEYLEELINKATKEEQTKINKCSSVEELQNININLVKENE